LARAAAAAAERRGGTDSARGPRVNMVRRACFDQARSGTCRYGAACKFSHDAGASGGPLAEERGRRKRGRDEGAEEGGTAAVASGVGEHADTQANAPAPLYVAGASAFERGVPRPRSLVERSFSRWYRPGAAVDGSQDVEIVRHVNGVILVYPAAAHAALLGGRAALRRVEFLHVGGQDLSAIEVSGKRKHGAVLVRHDDALLKVHVQQPGGGEQTVSLLAGISGKVMETNRRLADNPALLGTDEGWAAVLQQHTSDKVFAGLLPREAYLAHRARLGSSRDGARDGAGAAPAQATATAQAAAPAPPAQPSSS
jgi:hypothetical protein